MYNRKTLNCLEDSITDHKPFWYRWKQGRNKPMCTSTISIETWYDRFRGLFAGKDYLVDDNNIDLDNIDNVVYGEADGDIEVALFEQLISDEEVLFAVRSLNVNKACSGLLSARHFTICMEKLIPCLRAFFNLLFTTGKYPEKWREIEFVPIHKKVHIML